MGKALKIGKMLFWGMMAFRQNCTNISSLANNQLLPNIAGLASQSLRGFHVGQAMPALSEFAYECRQEGKEQKGVRVLMWPEHKIGCGEKPTFA